MKALVEIAGKQYEVEKGCVLKVPHLKGNIGEKVAFDKILYLDDGKNKNVGSPIVKDSQLNFKILNHEKSRKVIVFKFKRRKGYQKKNTHRQEFTLIQFDSLSKNKKTQSKSSKVAKSNTAVKKVVAKKATVKKTTTAKKTTVKKTEKNK